MGLSKWACVTVHMHKYVCAGHMRVSALQDTESGSFPSVGVVAMRVKLKLMSLAL